MVTATNLNNQHQPSRLRPAMDAINNILSANGHEEALSLTVQSVCDVLGQGASAAITLTDSQERLDTHSHFVAGPLSNLLTREAPRTDGVTVRVVQSCQPIIEPDVQKYEAAEHPQIRTKLGSVGAFACLPLAHNEHVYGALFVVFEEPFVFDEDAIVCLESMASLATRSIEMTEQLRTIEAQTMLQADTYRQFSAQLRSTWETVHTTASIKQTLDEILRRVDEEVIGKTDISASIYVYNEEDDRFKSGAARGPLKDYMVSIPPRKRGTARHALETGEPLFVDDATKAPTYVPQLHDEAKRYDVKAYANIPLVMGEGESKNTIGILIINLQQEFEFTDSIQSVLRVFSDQAAITLQSARVYRRRIREQQAVHEVSESAASGELGQVGLAVTRKAVELSHSDYATLWSVKRTANEINLVGHYTVREDWDLPGDRLPIDNNSMNGHTVLKGEAFYQTDLKRGHPHYASWHPEIKSAFCVPLRAGGELVGTLYVASLHQEINESHREFIQQLAVTAAIALRTAAHQAAISEFQERISDIETEESEYKDIYNAAYKVLTERKLLDTRNMYIALWDKITDKISFPLAYHDGELVPDEVKEPDNWDWDPEKHQWIPMNPEWNHDWIAYKTRARRKTNIGLTEWVIENPEEPLLIERGFKDECQRLGIKAFDIRTKSWLGAPMIVEREVIGVIGLQIFEKKKDEDKAGVETQGKDKNLFEKKHRQLLFTIAGQAAVAIANARKYDTVQKERRRRQTELKAIAEFQQRISHLATATSGYHDIYSTAHEVLSRRGLLDTRNMYIALWDKTTDEISFPLAYHDGVPVPDEAKELGNWDWDPEKHQWIPMNHEWNHDWVAWETRARRKTNIGLTEWVIENPEEPLLIERGFKDECQRLGIKAFDIRTKSWLGAPMIVEREVIGVIGLQIFEKKKDEDKAGVETQGKDKNLFEERHKQLLFTIAGQAAFAIEQERIAQEREERQRRFREISERMAAAGQEPGVALELVARMANELYKADLTSVFRYDSTQGEFESGVRIQADGRTEVVPASDLPNLGGMISRVAREQKVEYYPNKEQDIGETLSGYAEAKQIASYASLPLVVGTQTVGVMVINFTSERRFSRQDDETLRHLATQAALAIGFETAIAAVLANEQWEALGQATAALQHRINSTIALSIPVIMRLQYRYGDDPETVDMLETIERNTRYALQIFKRLKRVLGSGDKFDKASINILLRSAIKECVASGFEPPVIFTVQSSDDSISFTQSVPENTHDPIAIDITFEPDNNVPVTSLRAEAMQEVLHIVVENAIKSIVKMEPVDHGQIYISSRYLDENNQPDSVRGAIEITVTDNGGGIPEEKLERLVTEIVPRRDFMEGAGMGLWLSGIILRNHKGKITPHSDGEGKGATFTIRLPVLPSPPVHSPLLFNQEHDNNESRNAGS